MKELKESFERVNLLLTSSFFGSKCFLDSVGDYLSLSKYLDLVYFMQMFTPLIDECIEEAFNGRHIMNLKQNIDGLIKLGVPSTKIVLGLHFGGPEFKLIDNDLSEFEKMVDYNEICDLTLSNEWKKSYDKEASLAYLTQQNENRVIVFESTRSIANRIQPVVELNFAGIIASSIGMDDFRGECGIDDDTFDDFKPVDGGNLNILTSRNVTFPLLRTVNAAITRLMKENVSI